jgi:hypothetical protein
MESHCADGAGLDGSVHCSCGFNALGVDSFVSHVVSSVIEQIPIRSHESPDFQDGYDYLFDSITDHFTGTR